MIKNIHDDVEFKNSANDKVNLHIKWNNNLKN